MKIMKIGV